jgi:hypothetical protein
LGKKPEKNNLRGEDLFWLTVSFSPWLTGSISSGLVLGEAEIMVGSMW